MPQENKDIDLLMPSETVLEPSKKRKVNNEGVDLIMPSSALPLGVQMQPDVLSGQIQQPFGEDIKVVEDEEFLKDLGPADVVGGITGSIRGAKMGRGAGPVGIVAGSAVGGILGATLGKEVDEELGFRPERTVLENLGQSVKEEAVGRLLTPVVGGVVSLGKIPFRYVPDSLRDYGKKIGLLKDTPVEEKILKAEDTGVTGLSRPERTISEAQEETLGERPLTIFEETGGRAGRDLQAELRNKIDLGAGLIKDQSTYLAARDNIQKKLQQRLKGSQSVATTDTAMEEAVKESFVATRKALSSKLNEIDKQIVKLRPKVNIDASGLSSRLINKDVRETLKQKLGNEQGSKFFKLIKDDLKKYTKAQESVILDVSGKPFTKAPKGQATAADLQSLREDINSKIEQFSPTANVQGKKAGVISDAIFKPLDDYISNALLSSKNPNATKLAELINQKNALAQTKGLIDDTKVGRLLGTTEIAQKTKAKTEKQIENLIFSSPETWKQTKQALQYSNPTLIAELQEGFKNKIFRETFDPKKGELVSTKLINTLNKYSPELIKDVAGESYLKFLEDATLITYGQNFSDDLVRQAIQLKDEQKIMPNAIRRLVHPLAGRVGLMNAFSSKVKRALGLGELSDKYIYEMMKGEKGRRVIDAAINSPLNDPNAYNIYLNFTREAAKVGAALDPVSKEQFMNSTGALVGDILNTINEGAPAATQSMSGEQE